MPACGGQDQDFIMAKDHPEWINTIVLTKL